MLGAFAPVTIRRRVEARRRSGLETNLAGAERSHEALVVSSLGRKRRHGAGDAPGYAALGNRVSFRLGALGVALMVVGSFHPPPYSRFGPACDAKHYVDYNHCEMYGSEPGDGSNGGIA